MEILAALGLSQQLLINFAIFGLYANVFALIFVIIVTAIKISALDEQQAQAFTSFAAARLTVFKKNSPLKLLAHYLTFFLPMYVVWINSIFLYYMLKHSGANGLIMGSIKSDQFSIVNVVNYTFVDLNK